MSDPDVHSNNSGASEQQKDKDSGDDCPKADRPYSDGDSTADYNDDYNDYNDDSSHDNYVDGIYVTGCVILRRNLG